jgi:hypothetical protein
MLAAVANLSTVLMQFLNADSQVGGFVDIASHVLPVCDSISETPPSVERIPKLTSPSGQHFKCQNSEQFGSSNLDQGCFGSGLAWDVTALFKIPDEIASESAGPLMCGGASKPFSSCALTADSKQRHTDRL